MNRITKSRKSKKLLASKLKPIYIQAYGRFKRLSSKPIYFNFPKWDTIETTNILKQGWNENIH